jgi:hypothetical protein
VRTEYGAERHVAEELVAAPGGRDRDTGDYRESREDENWKRAESRSQRTAAQRGGPPAPRSRSTSTTARFCSIR